jgi:hypothetical protein
LNYKAFSSQEIEMKGRHFSILAVLLLLTLPSIAQGPLDLTIRGPWIIYVDGSHKYFKNTVLIAMAPSTHHPKNMKWPHMPPTVSNGEGYVLDDGDTNFPAANSQIYCLLFNTTCARSGPDALVSDSHPSPSVIAAFGPAGQNGEPGWKWFDISRNNSALTLILPMPDSFSSDTAWPMRFGAAFDPQGRGYAYNDWYSTGLILHYEIGPSGFGLIGCPNGSNGQTPSVSNCNIALGFDHTNLINKTGALRIEMKAPDNNWSCDPHVRSIYPRMLDLLPVVPGRNADQKVIDPAHDFNANDNSGVFDQFTGIYTSPPANPNVPVPSEVCLEHDSQGGYDDTRWIDIPPIPVPVVPMPNGGADPTCDEKDPYLVCVDKILAVINENRSPIEALCDNADAKDKTTCEAERKVLLEMLSYGKRIAFPRISQLQRLDDDLTFLVALKAQHPAPGKAHATKALSGLSAILGVVPSTAPANPYDKTHGDCNAPLVSLSDQ